MMNSTSKNWRWLAGVFLAAMLALGGCARMKQAKHEKAIRERHSQAVTALCKWMACGM
jgi:hypothetical protein